MHEPDMKTCVFLTTDDLEGYVTDDELALRPFDDLGWAVESISWRNPAVDWGAYDAVIVRTTWDYHKHEHAFINILEKITARTRLANSLDLIRWNHRKTYLSELSRKGLPVVPTVFDQSLTPDRFSGLFDELHTDEIVVKPVVSASAFDTFRIRQDRDQQETGRLSEAFKTRPFMAQPFLRRIVHDGELSLFYFNAEYSHAVSKTPRSGDFRVQEEHGGIIQPFHADSSLIELGLQVIHSLPEPPLYARVDLARNDGGNYLLMELELIEPALYFRCAPEAAQRFARAFDLWFNAGS